MKAVILAAGYATRLYPLTIDKPKALLPINDKPIIEYIVDEICTIDAVDEIYVISNHKFYTHFVKWAEKSFKKPLFVINDGTTNDDNKLGAIGDINFVIKEKCLDDNLMIIAGDNFFTNKLIDFYNFYKKTEHDCVCAKRIDDVELLRRFAVAVTDETGKITTLVEKPQHPPSDLAVYATYIYTRETARLFSEYLKGGNVPDAPGYFLQWLYSRKPAYAYEFQGECYDIGTPESYADVIELFKK